MVLEKNNFFYVFFFYFKSMGANDPREGPFFDHRGMVGRIYKEDYYTLLHTKYESSGPCAFRVLDFLCFSRFTQNMKAQGLVLSEY